MALFRVDPSSSEPLFQQLVHAVKRAVATGALRAGDRLPSVRELARELVINPNTISRAFRELEGEGVTVSRRGAGTFIAERRDVVRKDESRRRLREALENALSDAVNLGMSRGDLSKTFEAVLRKFRFDGEEER